MTMRLPQRRESAWRMGFGTPASAASPPQAGGGANLRMAHTPRTLILGPSGWRAARERETGADDMASHPTCLRSRGMLGDRCATVSARFQKGARSLRAHEINWMRFAGRMTKPHSELHTSWCRRLS